MRRWRSELTSRVRLVFWFVLFILSFFFFKFVILSQNLNQSFLQIDFTWAGRPGILNAGQVYLLAHFSTFSLLFLYLSERTPFAID